MPQIIMPDNLNPIKNYVVQGVEHIFTFKFFVVKGKDLLVYVNDVPVAPNNYTITGLGNPQGGNVDIDTSKQPLSVGDIVTLYRFTLPEQLTEFIRLGDFTAEAVNGEFNRLYALMQEARRDSLNKYDEGSQVVQGHIHFNDLTFTPTGKDDSPVDLKSYKTKVLDLANETARVERESKERDTNIDNASKSRDAFIQSQVTKNTQDINVIGDHYGATLPVKPWVKDEVTTNPFQRYMFFADPSSPAYGFTYNAPSATSTNPITLGDSPVSDSNWRQWDVSKGEMQREINAGDSQGVRGTILPTGNRSAINGEDLTGATDVKLAGGDFPSVTRFPIVKKITNNFPLIGNLSNINLTTKPYSATVGTEDVWLLDVKYPVAMGVNVKAFWAVGDGIHDDFVPMQTAINYVGNAITNGSKVTMPDGTYRITKPLMLYQKDGLNLVGSGKWAAKIQMSGAMTPDISSVPEWPADGVFRSYTYTDKPCAIMVAARRVTGGVDGHLNPAGANTAAWNLAFEGFTILGGKGNPYVADGFYIPDFGNGSFRDIDFLYVKAAWSSCDCYRTKIENCNVNNSIIPFNHFSTATQKSTGTTLGISNTGASRTEKGWNFTNMNYSSFNNVSCDSWGHTDFSSSNKYAWSFVNCKGITMSGCGAEMLDQTIPQGIVSVLNVGAGSSVTINSGLFLASIPLSNSEMVTLTGNSNIDNTEINIRHNGADPAEVVVRGGSQIVSNTYGNQNTSDLFKVLSGSLVINTPNMAPTLSVEENGAMIVSGSDGWVGIAHNTVLENPQLISNDNGRSYTCKQKGRYKLSWNYSVNSLAANVYWSKSRITVNGISVNEILFSENLKTQNPTHQRVLDLNIGDVVAWEGMAEFSSGGAGNCSVVNSSVNIERWY